MSSQFVFLLKDGSSVTIPNDLDFLNKIGKSIGNQLLKSGRYLINSNVDPQNLRLFLDYLTSDNNNLDINSDNYNDFYLLNNEFNNIISNIINKPEFDSIKKESILNALISKENENKSSFEKDIATDLDFYLNKCPEKLSQVPLTSLYNIFNHENRRLNDHEKAYQFIIENINKNNANKRSFCILIGTLDATKMNEKSVNESNMNKNEHFGFVPKTNDSFICEVNKNMTEMKNQIETKFEQLFSFMLNQQQQTLEKIIQNIDAKLSSIEQKYEILSNKIEESKKSIIQIQSTIQQVSQKTDTINDRTQLHFRIEHDPFNGIIHKLTEQCGGNVHEKGIVDVTSSSQITDQGFLREARYVVDFEDDVHYFCSDNLKGSWIKYNFKNKKIHPTHYSIKSTKYYSKGQYNLINWVIEGSNNDKDWIVLDSRNNVYDIDGTSLVQTFNIQKVLRPNEFFQYIRIRSTGLDSKGQNYILFSALEYFGSII